MQVLLLTFKDTIIFERLDPSCQELMEKTTEHLNVSEITKGRRRYF